jgi:hypothetical protein
MTALDRLGWAVDGSYQVGGADIGIRSTSEPFGAWLDDVLVRYQSAKVTQPVYSIVIADDKGVAKERYHILYRGTVAIVKTTDPRLLVETLRIDLEQYLFPERSDAIFADMTVLSLDGVNVLLPAVLAPFLETLGKRRVARSGLALPADTYVAIEPGSNHAVPIPRLVELAPGWQESLARAVSLNGGDSRPTVDRPTPIHVVASIGWGDDPLLPITKGLGLHRLGSHVVNLETLGGSAIEGLVPLIAGAQCYELASVKPAEMLPAILRLFERPG